ncbi:putative uncharacterized protein [Clostridium clostridioforme CAG:132]|uniref:Uncharacterized protein n=1 Tax=[Clostridium] clostridioforme CAG:132 TaxID=1263065 RepID=R6JF59_9FIRM|nr:DUF6809 family protein [Enterocloster clostridioformis]CDB61403.1 putative uncharacterized protein [[Clostridium] clostridioforme CAG:132]
MSSIIRKIYNGELNITNDVGVNSKEYTQLSNQLNIEQQDFRTKLPSNLIQHFDDLIELSLNLLDLGQEEGFIEGVRIGILLISEVHTDNG